MAAPPYDQDAFQGFYQYVPPATTTTSDSYPPILSCEYGEDDAGQHLSMQSESGFDSIHDLFDSSITTTTTSSSGQTTIPTTSISSTTHHTAYTMPPYSAIPIPPISCSCPFDPNGLAPAVNNGHEVRGQEDTGPQRQYTYDIDVTPALRFQQQHHTPATSMNSTSLQFLLPSDGLNGVTPRQASHLWSPVLQAPQFLLAKHEVKTPTLSLTNKSDEKLKTTRQTTEYTFVQQRPDRVPPAGQLTKIRQTAMKNFLLVNGGDTRLKRKKRQVSEIIDVSGTESSRKAAKNMAMDGGALKGRAQRVKDDKHATEESTLVEPTTVMLSSGSIDRDTMDKPRNGIVWHGAPDVLYSPFFTSDIMTVYLAEPMKEMQLPSNSLGGRINQFREWPEFPLETKDAERLKYYCT